MMILGATSSYPNGIPIYGVSDEVISSSIEPNSATPSTHPSSFMYNLSLLKDKIHQVQSLATIFLAPDHGHPPGSTSIAIPTMGTLIQEIIMTASSMMFSCQQIMAHDTLLPPAIDSSTMESLHHNRTNKIVDRGGAIADSSGINGAVEDRGRTDNFYTDHRDTLEDQWFDDDNYNNFNSTAATSNGNEDQLPAPKTKMVNKGLQGIAPKTCEGIIELDAADLLAKYTHYCQVCSKGFKRDANLRMHMRAHGDEYKSSAALSNPNKNNVIANHGENTGGLPNLPRNWKYSCPQEGCRWNKKHEKFQPLKSMICAKNHYKRSHCPKMYVCKRCNRKKFSVLSDLRTHEKHCGDLKWQCSCGTTFSRKDKLMGHVALFVGHTPAVTSFIKMGDTFQTHAVRMQLDPLK